MLQRWTLLFLCCVSSATLGQKPFFRGIPTFDNLNPQVIFNQIFHQAPEPKVNVLHYEAIELPTKIKYSNYTIQLDQTKHQMTKYHTKEMAFNNRRIMRDPNASVIYGNGVGHGGIFSLAYLKKQSLENWRHQTGFVKKYEITDITRTRGNLFPLQVGNKLVIEYQKRHFLKRSGKVRKDIRDNGRFVYHVVNQFQGYSRSANPVSGNIFVIRVHHASSSDPVLQPMFEYWYAEDLGWYIATKYYKQGQLVARYRLIDWR